MAKKKSDDAVELKMDDFVGRLRSEITKGFGNGVFKSAQDVLNKKLKIIPWSKSMDDGIGGGLVEGSWISISGPKKVGKTTSFLTFAASAQKHGKTVFFLCPEARLKDMNLNGIKGLDQDPNKFVIIESSEDKILSTQDYLNIAERIIKTYPGCVIIIDSISALADQRELDEGLGCQTRGGNQKVISQFINNVAQIVSVNRTIVCGIVHLIANTSGFGASQVEKQPNRWGYQADYILRAKYADKWLAGSGENSEVIGQIIHWECLTSAIGIPYGKFDSYLRFKVGLDNVYEQIQYATNCGLITKAGAWYELSFLASYKEILEELNKDSEDKEKLPKLQGSENVWQFINENQILCDILAKETNIN